MFNAVITGATQGIGKAIAEKLLSEGFSIAICARSKENLQLVRDKWLAQYPLASVLIAPVDVSSKDAVKEFADEIATQWKQVHLLVNNAGTFIQGLMMDEPDGHLERLMHTNLFSAYHLTRGLFPLLKNTPGSHVFNMCSIASLKAYPYGGAYGISKYALLGFSDNLREEFKPYNIRVTSLCPGATYTPSWKDSGVDSERMMDANDVANMLWSAYNLSVGANVETVVMRPIKGDL
jgi:short-subunit dehydrogenase